MAINIFPDVPIQYDQVTCDSTDYIVENESGSGKVYKTNYGPTQEKLYWTFDTRDWTVAQEQTLREFRQINRFLAYFVFFDPDPRMAYSDISCAVNTTYGGGTVEMTFVDGSTMTFADGTSMTFADGGTLGAYTIPAKSTAGHVVYVDDVEISSSEYTIVADKGPYGEDLIVFDESPSGAVTCDFTGRYRYYADFPKGASRTYSFYQGKRFVVRQVFV